MRVMDHVIKFADTLVPFYRLNDWHITTFRGANSLAVPTHARVQELIQEHIDEVRPGAFDRPHQLGFVNSGRIAVTHYPWDAKGVVHVYLDLGTIYGEAE